MEKKEVILVLKQSMAALKYLHGEKIVHRDIKPENILYENRTTWLTFLLADFGSSTRSHFDIPRVGARIYFAPEVWSGAQQEFGHKIWSLGVVIYEIVIYEILKGDNFTQ